MSGAANILHADLDAFYASVEQLLDPALRGRPIAVGGGVVLAASYEAKAFGVSGGMSGWRAKQLCPKLQFVGGHFREYQRLADQVMTVFEDFTPLVERISIDEAFLNVAGAVRLFGSPTTIAQAIRQRVRDEIGLPVSVGVAGTKHLAKVASQVAKPDGLVVVEPGDELAFLHPLPVGLMWGVGPVTRARLAEQGVTTIGQLAELPGTSLEHLLGHAAGSKLGALAVDHDPRPLVAGVRAKSVGAQSAFGRRDVTPDLIRAVVGHLSDRVASRLRAKQRAGRTVTVRIRFPPTRDRAARSGGGDERAMRSITRSVTLLAPIATTLTLAEVAEQLVHAGLADHPGETQLSLLAVSVSGLTQAPVLQLEMTMGLSDEPLRPGTPAGAARWAVDHQMDAVRTRFGRSAVGYTSTVFSAVGQVPDEFRELAEHDG